MKVPKKAIITGAAIAGALAAGAAIASSDLAANNMRVQTMYGPIVPIYRNGTLTDMPDEHVGAHEDT